MVGKGQDSKGRFTKGNKANERTGAYAEQMSPRIRRHGENVRAGLIKDLGPTEADLTTAQLILIDKAVALLEISLTIENHIREHGAFRGETFDPVLGNYYISYQNTLRLTLDKLGALKRVGDRALSITDLAAEIERDKKEVKEAGVKEVPVVRKEEEGVSELDKLASEIDRDKEAEAAVEEEVDVVRKEEEAEAPKLDKFNKPPPVTKIESKPTFSHSKKVDARLKKLRRPSDQEQKEKEEKKSGGVRRESALGRRWKRK